MVANALSRPPAVAAVVPPASTGLLNWAQLATEQTSCKDLAALHAKQLHHLVAVQVEGFPVWCDVSMGVWRTGVPKDFRQQVFDTIQGLVHPGVCATLRQVSNRFVWPGLATDVNEWSRQCVTCCSAKVTHVDCGALWCGENPHTWGLFLPHACGPGGPTPSQQGWDKLPADND